MPRSTARVTIDRLGPLKRFWFGVPIGWIGTLCFASTLAVANDAAFCVELFGEGRWTECRRECLRTLAANPRCEPAILLQAVTALRLGIATHEARGTLERLAAGSGDPDVRSMAALEAGGLARARGEPDGAWALWRRSCNETRDPGLVLRSACALDRLRREHPDLGRDDSEILRLLETARPLWTPQIEAEVAGGPMGAAPLAARPAEWIVAFYRRQIAPAIGARCSLEPTCSEYFLQASRAHGLMGFAMSADRFFREPSVVAAARATTNIAGQVRVLDPVADHAIWRRD